MDLVELLQREIQQWKEKWAKLKEENVNLVGFRSMVMEDPKKYNKPGPGHNGPPDDGEEQDNPTVFDVARDDFKKELNWKGEEVEGVEQYELVGCIFGLRPELYNTYGHR